jgi:type I restriction enzyme, S subunit
LIIVPDRSVLAAFNSLAQPFYDRIVLAKQEARILASVRDILLPRLISGELRITDAEKRIAAA